MKKEKKIIWTSIFTAFAASLCCITPVLALISGVTGMAASFSWIEPLRPYLIGITLLTLGFAWYQKLRPAKEMECNCQADEKPKFIQSKKFLGIVTAFAIVMLAFPCYGKMFYPKAENKIVVADKSNVQKINLAIKGMSCNSCEAYVNHAVHQLDGIVYVEASYKNANAIVAFDKTKTNEKEIEKAVNSTGYKVTKITENN